MISIFGFEPLCKKLTNLMALVNRVSRAMQTIAPLSLSESWDNTGWLLEAPFPRQDATKVFLTIDLTKEVLDEAIANKDIGVIISYHPPLFVKFKTLLMSDPKQSIALKCAASGISIYSPHTALDSCVGGINDWLVRGLGPGKTLPVSTIKDQPEGQDGCGVGRIHYLEAPTTLNEISKRIKAFLGLEYLRIGQSPIHNQNKKIESVAVCAGSGASVLRNTRVDLYLTGEMSHHEVLDATSRDTSVVLCEHSNSERGYLLHELKPRLEREFGLEVVCSQLDTDPLKLYQ